MYMKEIKLESMHVEKFKGLHALDVQFGERTEISGRNALGKTCVYDAYLWCLFNKDSRGRVIDKVQKMDDDGKVEREARTVVSVVFLIDGQRVDFRREFYQSWSKKRGTTEYVYNGNASDYFYNDVPLSMSEYNKKIEEFFDRERFELVSNINLFASFDVAKRRGILEQIADIESLTKLISAEYPTVVMASAEGKTIEELQAELRKRMARVKTEAEAIPVRIDEIQRGIPETMDFDELRSRLAESEAKKQAHQKAIERYRQLALAGANSEVKKELNAVADKIAAIAREATLEFTKERNKAQDALMATNMELESAKRRKKALAAELEEIGNDILKKKEEFETLRAEWNAINEESYAPGQSDAACPTCGHVFTPEELAERADKAVRIFNSDKLKRMNEKEEKAKALKAVIDKLSDDHRAAEEKVKKAEDEVVRLQGIADNAAKNPVVVKTAEERVAANAEYASLIEKRSTLEQQLASDKPVTYDEEIKQEQGAMDGLTAEIASLNSNLAKEQQIKNANARIAELKEQDRKLGQERADIEKQLDELTAFSQRKMNAIEERINGMFQFVKIRMFEQNLTNDGVKDVCDITVDGIPYSVLNTASRINAGIDICRTLALAYGMKAPIWVDNAESVNTILGGDCQLVTLRVTEEANLTIQ